MDTGFLVLLGIFAAGVLIYLYFLPAIIAHKNNHPSSSAITVLNLLLGWTFVGWVISMVWAFNNPTVQAEEAARVQPESHTRLCPYCAEAIQQVAIKCKHCGSDLITNPADFVGS